MWEKSAGYAYHAQVATLQPRFGQRLHRLDVLSGASWLTAKPGELMYSTEVQRDQRGPLFDLLDKYHACSGGITGRTGKPVRTEVDLGHRMRPAGGGATRRLRAPPQTSSVVGMAAPEGRN